MPGFELRRVGPSPVGFYASGEQARIAVSDILRKHMLIPGLRTVRDPSHSPKLTGQLIRSTGVQAPIWQGRVLRGSLFVGVVYGRFQEFRNRTKRFYLLRAARAASDSFKRELSSVGLESNFRLQLTRRERAAV